MAVKENKYTVADVYKEAQNMLQTEMIAMKQRPLTGKEEEKMQQLGKLISKLVLKEMNSI